MSSRYEAPPLSDFHEFSGYTTIPRETLKRYPLLNRVIAQFQHMLVTPARLQDVAYGETHEPVIHRSSDVGNDFDLIHPWTRLACSFDWPGYAIQRQFGHDTNYNLKKALARDISLRSKDTYPYGETRIVGPHGWGFVINEFCFRKLTDLLAYTDYSAIPVEATVSALRQRKNHAPRVVFDMRLRPFTYEEKVAQLEASIQEDRMCLELRKVSSFEDMSPEVLAFARAQQRLFRIKEEDTDVLDEIQSLSFRSPQGVERDEARLADMLAHGRQVLLPCDRQ